MNEPVKLPYRPYKEISLAEAIKWHDVGKIKQRFGTWVVTDWGIECLASYYPIEAKRLWEMDWTKHIAEKTWVVQKDFRAAYEAAKEYHARCRPMRREKVKLAEPKQSKATVRCRVWERDDGHCGVCGDSVVFGEMELDHIVPKSLGGDDDYDNLQPAHASCNRLKGGKNRILTRGEVAGRQFLAECEAEGNDWGVSFARMFLEVIRNWRSNGIPKFPKGAGE